MEFACDRCDARYVISDEKVGPNGVKIRCKKCGNVLLVRGALGMDAAAPVIEPPSAIGGSGEELEAALGQAFDAAFGDGPGQAPSQELRAAAAVPLQAAPTPAPEPPAPGDWYVAIGQAQVGPLPLVEVRRRWESGDLGPDSLVWRPGMAEWVALTGAPELSAYLAPVPRGAAAPPAPSPVPALAAARAEPRRFVGASWQPAGATALSALASEEISGNAAARAEPKPTVGARALAEVSPEDGVDPSGALPLRVSALAKEEETTSRRRSSVALGTEQLRKRRTATRTFVVGMVVLALAVLGAGGFVAYRILLRPRLEAVDELAELAARSAPAQEKAVAVPTKVEATPAPPPASAPAPAAPEKPAATAADVKPAAPREPAAEKPARGPEKVAAAPGKAAAPPPTKVATSRSSASKPAAGEKAVAADAPPVGSKEDLLAAPDQDVLGTALGEATTAGGRSHYIPPDIGGGGGSPAGASITDGQIAGTIQGNATAFRRCVPEKGPDDPDTLRIRWAIAPDGAVRDVRSVTVEGADTPYARCLLGAVKRMRFPKSAAGRQEVTQPFSFRAESE